MKRTERITITPEMAKNVLETSNPDNRPISPREVDMLAREMEAGRFKDNGDTFKFDTTGRLLDGQHRLAAIAKSGIPLIDAIIVYGISPDAVDTIDSGRKRSASDKAKFRGLAMTRNYASVARNRIQYLIGDLSSNRIISDLELLELFTEKQDLFQNSYSMAMKIYNSPLKIMPCPFAAVLSFVIEYDSDAASGIVKKLYSGEGLVKGDPCLLYRKTVAKFTSGPRGRWDRRCFMNLTVGMFNLALQGKKAGRSFDVETNTSLFFVPVTKGAFSASEAKKECQPAKS